MFTLPKPPFLLLPARFLLFGLMMYVGLEMLAALSLEYIPALSTHQQTMVLLMRLFELLVFIALIYRFDLRQSLGLTLPDRQQVRVFMGMAGLCVAAAAVLYALQPGWFAYVGIPTWIHGYTGLLLMVFLAPMVEELIFRGLLYRMLREQWNVMISVAVSAVFFSLLHQGQVISPQLAGGIIFALAYEWSKSLWVAIGLHMGANSAVYALSLL